MISLIKRQPFPHAANVSKSALFVMYGAAQNAARSQLRGFSVSAALAAKTQGADSKKLKDLKSKLTAEKKKLKKLQDDLKKNTAKANEKKKKAKAKTEAAKAKQKQDKLLEKAFKSFRRLSAFNMYVKENKGGSLAEASTAWTRLTESEKDSYQDKADEFNDGQLQIYTPKPKSPSIGFARYLQENFVKDDRENSQIFSELSGKWRALSPIEKSKYAKDESEWSRYEQELKSWKTQRVKLFNDASKSKITVTF